MSITEILSEARTLPADEKRQLAQALIEDLANNEPEAMYKEGHVFTVCTPSLPRRLLGAFEVAQRGRRRDMSIGERN